MKTCLILLLFSAFSLLMTDPAQAQPGGRAGDEAQVRAVLSRQSEAWNRHDLEAFMQDYWKSDSLMFIGKSGVTYGWSNTLANYRKNYPDNAAMGTLNFRLIKVKRLSSTYYSVVGRWELQRLMGDLSGHFSLLFQKIAGKWVIISDHSS